MHQSRRPIGQRISSTGCKNNTDSSADLTSATVRHHAKVMIRLDYPRVSSRPYFRNRAKRHWRIPRYGLRTFLITAMQVGGGSDGTCMTRERARCLMRSKIIAGSSGRLATDETVPGWRLGIKAIREITLDKGRAISVMDAKVISHVFR